MGTISECVVDFTTMSAYFATVVRDRLIHWLNDAFIHWFGRRGHVEWSLHSDLKPLGFISWDMLKQKLYSRKIRDLYHLRECTTSHCSDTDDPPENFHLTVKKLPKTWHFFSKILPLAIAIIHKILFCAVIIFTTHSSRQFDYFLKAILLYMTTQEHLSKKVHLFNKTISVIK